jgi:uncharacterized protein YdaU (DUF1376 family)
MSTTANSIVTLAPAPKRQARVCWYCWYPADFMTATQGWPLIAKGAYRELLDAQWNMGGLPADEASLKRLISATPSDWKAIWPLMKSKLPVASDGKRRNPRLEEERVKAIKRITSATKAADIRHGRADRA